MRTQGVLCAHSPVSPGLLMLALECVLAPGGNENKIVAGRPDLTHKHRLHEKVVKVKYS